MESLIYQELLNIADARGVEIIEYDFKSTIKGLYIQTEGVELISLSPSLKDDLEYRNFVLAHELGHQELHKGKINQSLYFNNKDYLDELEEEANSYANKLIQDIRKKIKEI